MFNNRVIIMREIKNILEEYSNIKSYQNINLWEKYYLKYATHHSLEILF